jgi:hypothetical protein
MAGTATYLYCLVNASTRPTTSRAPRGLPGASALSLLPFGRASWLVVADVPLDTYGPDRLDAALGDLDWVSAIAVAHEAVVEHFTRRRGATVIPMKLFTMFSTRARALAEMQTRRADIQAVLKRLRGCEEWGVRVHRSPGTRRQPAIEKTAGARSGAAFLTARKQARDSVRELAAAGLEAADRAFSQLAPVARETRRRDEAPEGASVPPLLDAAFLVPAVRRARFRALAGKAAADCAKAGAAMTLTGPWPAYNFVQDTRDQS